MRIAILTTPFFRDCEEVIHVEKGGVERKGEDKVIWGGAERYLIDLCKLLQDNGHTITVYQPFPNIEKAFSKQFKGITFVMIPNFGGWKYGTCVDLNWQFNELSALDDMRIYFATFLAFPYAKSPCITISHGIYWDNTQGSSNVNALDSIQRKEFFKRQIYGFKEADVCVPVDSNVKKVIQAIEPGAEKRMQIIYNYVDTEKFTPKEKDWEGTNILFPRRLTALRGSTEITRAFINLPQYNFTLVGQSHDEQSQKEFVNAHKNRKNFKFDVKPMDGMEEMYQKADISVIPTISTEGLSLSLLESMACGLPVITTPAGGLGDAVIDNYNALIYNPNHEDLAEHIDYLAKDEDLRKKFSKRNREIAVECFDKKLWENRWLNLIKQFGGE